MIIMALRKPTKNKKKKPKVVDLSTVEVPAEKIDDKGFYPETEFPSTDDNKIVGVAQVDDKKLPTKEELQPTEPRGRLVTDPNDGSVIYTLNDEDKNSIFNLQVIQRSVLEAVIELKETTYKLKVQKESINLGILELMGTELDLVNLLDLLRTRRKESWEEAGFTSSKQVALAIEQKIRAHFTNLRGFIVETS